MRGSRLGLYLYLIEESLSLVPDIPDASTDPLSTRGASVLYLTKIRQDGENKKPPCGAVFENRELLLSHDPC